jgi:zinc transport system substrate-binding protein
MVQGNSPQTIEVSDMQDTISGRFGKALGIGCAVMMAMMALAGTPAAAASDKSHSHEAHKSDDIYRGYFEDSQIEARTLADWEGDWQSVYPYLIDRSLDPVLAHKAENGEKTVEEYRAYYQTGYKTDVERIVIDGDTFTFYREGNATSAHYASDGHEVLTYKKGNRGVRYIFKKNRRRCRSTDVRSVQRPCHRSGEGRALSHLLGRRPRRPFEGGHQLADLLSVEPDGRRNRQGNAGALTALRRSLIT